MVVKEVNMSIDEMHSSMTKSLGKRLADVVDGAAYAYVSKQLDYITEIGGNPSDYEVVMARDEFPQYIEDADGTRLKIDNRIRVERRKDIENLPIIN
jgi:hypothetical protein